MNEIFKEDFENILKNYNFDELKSSVFFVTGATGLIGSQILLFFDFLNEKKNLNIKLFGLARNREKAKKVFGDLLNSNINLIYGDVLSLPDLNFDIDYIVHGASITSSIDFINKAVQTIDIAINGTMNILNLAKQKNIKSMVYLSSMEVFGITDGNNEVKEENLGYINILSPRSSYSESKRMCECLCASFTNQYKVPVKIGRLTQTLGAGIDYNDTRVAAYFARCVIENNDIVLKTDGKTKRPIIYSADALSGIFTILLKANNGEAYSIANPKTFYTIKDTAQTIVDKIAKNKIELKFKLSEVVQEYAPNLNLNLNLNVDKLLKLGWKPSVNLEDAYYRMIESMKNDKILD